MLVKYITNNQYGGVLIDVPALMNRMKLNAYRSGKLVYDQADADRLLINPLITKRFNPKTNTVSMPQESSMILICYLICLWNKISKYNQ